MDIATARLLCDMTSDFYRQQAASFSQTRQAPWPGWRTCVDVLRRAGLGGDVAVLDLACGNLRFESFLAESLAPAACTFYAVDNCDGLVSSAADGARGRGLRIASAGPASGGAADNGRASDGESHLDVRFQSLDVMEAARACMTRWKRPPATWPCRSAFCTMCLCSSSALPSCGRLSTRCVRADS